MAQHIAVQRREAAAPRRERILELRRAGRSLSEIAGEVGLTRQRVHAVLRFYAPELAGRQQHTPAA